MEFVLAVSSAKEIADVCADIRTVARAKIPKAAQGPATDAQPPLEGPTAADGGAALAVARLRTICSMRVK